MTKQIICPACNGRFSENDGCSCCAGSGYIDKPAPSTPLANPDASCAEGRAWLIEKRTTPPSWLCEREAFFGWTTDSLKAIRFSRRCDAEQIAAIIGDDADAITEHQWGPDPQCLSAAEQRLAEVERERDELREASWLQAKATSELADDKAVLKSELATLKSDRDSIQATIDHFDAEAAKLYPPHKWQYCEAICCLLGDAEKWKAELERLRASAGREDDGEAYSGDDWIEGVGLAVGITKDGRGRWWAEAHQDGQRIVLSEIKTKGDRLRLLSTLGITLNEKGG